MTFKQILDDSNHCGMVNAWMRDMDLCYIFDNGVCILTIQLSAVNMMIELSILTHLQDRLCEIEAFEFIGLQHETFSCHLFIDIALAEIFRHQLLQF